VAAGAGSIAVCRAALAPYWRLPLPLLLLLRLLLPLLLLLLLLG
jgi:hypothetical protein